MPFEWGGRRLCQGRQHARQIVDRGEAVSYKEYARTDIGTACSKGNWRRRTPAQQSNRRKRRTPRFTIELYIGSVRFSPWRCRFESIVPTQLLWRTNWWTFWLTGAPAGSAVPCMSAETAMETLQVILTVSNFPAGTVTVSAPATLQSLLVTIRVFTDWDLVLVTVH